MLTSNGNRKHHQLVSNFYFQLPKRALGFPGGSVVKNLPAKQEMWVWSLSWEDPLEKDMATLSSILAREIPWTEEPGGLQTTGSQRVIHNLANKQQQQSEYFSFSKIRNGCQILSNM